MHHFLFLANSRFSSRYVGSELTLEVQVGQQLKATACSAITKSPVAPFIAFNEIKVFLSTLFANTWTM